MITALKKIYAFSGRWKGGGGEKVSVVQLAALNL